MFRKHIVDTNENLIALSRSSRGWLGFGLAMAVILVVKTAILTTWLDGLDLVAPLGEDPLYHWQIIKDLQGGLLSWPLHYPIGFHGLIAGLAAISRIDPFYLLTHGTPYLLIGGGAAVFILGGTLAGPRFGFWAGTLWTLTAVAPLAAYADGNYPNLLAGAVFLPLTLAALIQFLRGKKWYGLGFWLGTVAILLTHHLTAAYAALLFTIFGFLCLWYQRRERMVTGRWLMPVLTGLGLGLGVLVLYGPGILWPIVVQSSTGSLASAFGNYWSQPLDWAAYPGTLGNFLWGIGLLGGLWLVLRTWQRPAAALLVVWLVLLLILSRLSATGLPVRFARDLAVPLALLGALLLEDFFTRLETRWQHLGASLGIGLVLLSQTTQLVAAPLLPDSFQSLQWFTRANLATAEEINRLIPQTAVVIANPSSPYWGPTTGRTVNYATANNSTSQPIFEQKIHSVGAAYLLLGPKPSSNPGTIYPFYANFDDITHALEIYPEKHLIRQFPDGTRLFELTQPGQAAL